MQLAFMPRCGTTDAIFIICHLQEKYHALPWLLLIWKRHSIVYTGVLSGGLFASLVLRSGWCPSYRAFAKMLEAECMPAATWVKSSKWKWVFSKALAWAPYCSSRFWMSSLKSFVKDVTGKICKQVFRSSSLKRWGGSKRRWSSGRLTWIE